MPRGALTASLEAENLRARHLAYWQSFVWPVQCFPKIWMNRQTLKTCISGFSLKMSKKKVAHFEPLFPSGSYFWVTSVYPGQALPPLSCLNSVSSLPSCSCHAPVSPNPSLSHYLYKRISNDKCEDCTFMKIWIKNMLAEVTGKTHHCTCRLKY